MVTKTLNLAQKLIEVRKAVPFIEKDATNQFHRFDYTSSSAVLASVRQAMDKQGVLLVPRVIKATVLDHTTAKGKHEFFTTLEMEFTWVNADDPSETIVCPWYGQGLDAGELGVGKAMTYSEKFFILKSFNIPTDKQDPDAGQKGSGSKPAKKAEPREPMPSQGKDAPKKPFKQGDYDPKGDTRPATEPQLKRLFAKSKAIEADDAEMKAFLAKAAGVASSKDLNREQIDNVFKLMETFEAAGPDGHQVFQDWMTFTE